MYFHAVDEGLGQPPRIPNPDLKRHCPTLRDMMGHFVDWMNYVQRTANPDDAISKSLRELKEKPFIRESDFANYVERCKQASAPPSVPSPIKANQLSPELISEIIKALTGIRWPPPQKPKVQGIPTEPPILRMRDL